MTTDVARQRPDDLVRASQADFAALLPSHVKPAQFVRVATGALRDPNLWKAATSDPASLMSALMEAARLGLEPGTPEYWLTPRAGKVLGIVGYEGEIELIYRAGAVASVKAELVRERDRFDFSPSDDRPHHEVDWFGDRGAIRGAYAYAEMVGGGFSKVVVIGPEQIERAMSASGTAKSSHSPWSTDYGAMVLKTAVHQLAKWVPTSAEYRREMTRNAAELATAANGPRPAPVATHTPPEPDVDTVTGEIVDPPEVA